jgi:glucan endo-1,3-beta-D-glucosidase
MMKMFNLLSLALPLVQAANTIYTGFNYAQNLSTPVPFNSARLFSCKQQGTVDDHSEAFDAAVETKTKLFLGMWISPAKRGDPLDDLIKNELSALDKGFAKHGQALADLVVGLSVGSEDIYRWEDNKDAVGVSAADISAAIETVKDTIASSPFAKYMKGKPVGHVDTAKHSVVAGADFYGITVYPYWNKDPVVYAKDSFKDTLDNVVLRANGIPVWIAEVGWPFQGPAQGASQADGHSLQHFWTEVGCTILGKYTMFWFELINDAEVDQPDWGMIDTNTHKPRIDMSCPGTSRPVASAPPASTLVTSVVAMPSAVSAIRYVITL